MLGAWHGNQKPAFDIFLRPLANQLNTLKNGISMTTPDGEKMISLSNLTMTADNPAKEGMMKLKKNACGSCFQVCVNLPNPVGGPPLATWPLQVPPAALRTRESLMQDAEHAINTGHPHHGVKGLSSLLLVEGVDPILPIDYQHNVCLNVVKRLLQLWFDHTYAGKPWSIIQRVDDFDRLMTGMKAPGFITRPPRAFTDELKHWKAVEYRSFLLYFGPMVMKEMLTP